MANYQKTSRSHILSGQNVDLLTYNSSLIHSSSTTSWPHRYSYRHVSTPREFSLTAPEPFSKIYTKSDTTMSRYTSPNYEPGSRRYDTSSSYKSFDSGSSYRRPYGLASSASSYSSPRSFTLDSSSAYSPAVRSYSSTYTSRSGSSDSATLSRISTRTSASKWDDASKTSRDILSSRNGRSSPHTSLSHLSSAARSSPRSSISSEPSLERESPHDTSLRRSSKLSRLDLDRRSDSGSERDISRHRDNGKNSALDDYRASRRAKENSQESDVKRSWRTRIDEYKTKNDDTGSTESDPDHRSVRRRPAFKESSSSEQSTETNYRSKYRNQKSANGDKTENVSMKETVKDSYTESGDNVYIPFSERKKQFDVKKSVSDADDAYIPFSDRKKKHLEDVKENETKPEVVNIAVTEGSGVEESNRSDVAEESLIKVSQFKDIARKISDSSDSHATDELDALKKAERIARYKEERRKQFAAISNVQTNDSQPLESQDSLKTADQDNNKPDENVKIIPAHGDGIAACDKDVTGSGKANASSDKVRTPRRRLPDIPVQSLKEKEQRLQDFIHSQARYLRQGTDSSTTFEDKLSDKRHSPVTKPAMTTNGVKRTSSLKTENSRPQDKTSVNRRVSQKESTNSNIDNNSPFQHVKTSSSLSASPRESPVSDKNSRLKNQLSPAEHSNKSKETKAKHSGSDRYTPKARRSKSDISLSPRSVEVIKSHTNITEYSRESESPDTHHDTKSGTKSSKSDQLKLQQIASFKNTGELASHRATDDNDNEVRNKTGKKDDDSLTPHAVTSSGNLDDLLKENANYLSDVDLDLPDLTPLSKKSSTNDSSLRRSLRKKKLVRSSSSKGKGDKLKAGAYSDLKRNSHEDTNSTSPPDLSHRGKEDSEASTTSVTKKETNNARKSLVYPEVQAEPSPSPTMRKKDIPEDDKQLVTNKDSVCGSTESENFYSAPSTPTSREYVKKKKKDKSALRKSALNMRDDDEDSSKNGSTCGSSLDSSNVTQNRVSDMKTPSKVTLTQHEQVPPQNTSVISPLHASTASVSIISRAKALQEKVKKANESKPAEPEEILPRPIRRGKDFHQLLSKFSSSEMSGSDPDPASTTNTGRRVLTLCRQDNIVVSSSDESNTERRTPERTSSFQYRSPTKTPTEGKVQRSGSFKSEFMKRRYSVEKSDKPDDELQAVLCQRSNIVEKQQVEAKRKLSSKESRVEKAPERKASDVDEVIADREVLAVLKARRKETDAKTVVDNDGESANRTDDSKADIDKLDSSLALLNKVKNDLESPISSSDLEISSSSYIPSSSTRKKSGSENISEAIKYVHDVETSISTCISSSLSNTKENGDSLKEANTKGQESHHVASKSEISEPEVSYTVSLSNSQMPNSINKTDKRTSEEKRLSEERDFAMPLAKEEKWVTDRRQRREPRAEPGEDLWSDVDITDEVTLPTVHSTAEVTSTEKQTADNGQTAQLVEDSHTSGSDAASVTVSQRQSSNSANNAASVSVLSTLTATTSTPESPSVPNVTNLRRAESLKESSSPVHRTDSFQKRKGILKRTPSLPKQSSPVIVDKELAQLLQKQKSKCEDTSEDELNERTRTKSISALEEIDEISRREKRADDEDESMKQLSVTQRIFAMQKKIEEEKLAAITPKSASQSGYTTPRSALKIWCQNETGAGNKVNGDSSNTQAVSGEQLIEKLNKLSEQTNVQEVAGLKLVHKQRERFQQRHRADDWRRKTQPVTVDEVKEADSLESVFAFRALVRRQSSKNVFQHLKELEMTKKLPSDKKPEFPQHAIPNKLNKRRNRLERYHTQPVTADELNAIPEGQESPMNSNFRSLVKNDSKADSGILSGSEVEMSSPDCLRSFSLDMDNNENDPVSLSVSAKTSIFRQMEEKTKAEKDKYKASASGAKRYIDRKRRERIRTQPVTEDEVKTASEIAERTESEKKPDVANRSQSVESETENSDELAGLSVVEKVRLFSESKAKKDEAVKHDVPVPRRRARKQATRFATQPVTTEEVVKAASLNRVSPLAATLIKPPEPDILQGLPLAAQRELIVLHAQQCLSQPSSRRSSFGDMDQISKEDSSKEADSKETQVKDSPEVKGILKHQVSHQSPDHDVKSILKTEKDKKDSQEPKSILKRSEADESSQKQTELVGKGILKHSHSLSKSLDGTSKGILKASDLQTSPVLESNLKHSLKQVDSKLSSSENSLNRGILKSGGAFDNLNSNANCEIGSGDKKHDLISPQTKSPMHKESVKEKQTDSSEDLEQKNDENNHQEVTEVTSETVFYISDSSSPEKETTPERSSESTSVKRKSRFQDRKSQGERYLTQPADLGASKSPVSQSKKKYEGRHMTQPITPEEMKEAEAGSTPVRATSSISERLNALKQSGETSWKKRLPKQLDYDTPVAETKLRSHSNRDLSAIRPSSIADRLSQIEVAKGGWKERVEEKDQTKFTVAGKLSKTGQGHTESPLVARLKQTPKREGISLSGDSGSSEPSPVTSPSDPKEFISPSKKIPIPKEKISDEIPVVKGDKQKGDGEKVEPVTVEVPKMVDQELDSMFFQTKDISEIEDKVECDTDDFNEIFIQANDILPAIRRVRPSRRKPAQSQNPLKTMSQHIEIKQEYTQVDRGVAELEFRRFKKEQLSKETGFAQEALAGLASKENFSKIELRKMDEASTPGTAQRYEPFKNLMLLHIKGRRTVQTRLVEPSCKSLNSGDCFILVTPDKVIHWIGEFSNVIEKAKSSEIASVISTKKDLGCRSSVVLTTVDEVKSQLGIGTVFWSALGGQSEYQACGPDEEDELFESHLIKTNMVYRLVDNSLEPYEKYWGVLPKYEMLKKEEVLVFDFGGEMYLWMGTAVSMDNRKRALKLAQKLWDRGYDYSECNLNPLSPLRTEEDGGLKMADTKRPDWALFGKVSQNMETVLFREKFSDWPDTSRIIRCRGHSEEKQKKSDISELKPCDVKKMLEPIKTPVSLVLEGSHVGRGTKWKEDVDGLVREFDVLTLSTATWHVLEYDHYKLPELSYGQFHDGDTYVVRWQYMITASGIKSLKGHSARHSLTGREKCAYFFWQGNKSTVNEKGASALMTVELDEERGPQVRVVQGKEPPCFLNLFKGKMIIHIGKREDPSTNTQGSTRFYWVRGEFDNELCLVEIPLQMSNLRSRSSLLVLSVSTGLLYVWHGCKSLPHARNLALTAAQQLKSQCPLEVGLHKDACIVITEIEEGQETSAFWTALDGYYQNSYLSLIKDPKPYTHTIRIFNMCSVSGVLEVNEVPNPSRSEMTTPFPFLQSDLYKPAQPALFLIDNDHEVYLWQGWWPVATEEQENVKTGSAHARFNVDRKCAIQTAIDYCNEKNPDSPPGAYHVCAGVEPQCFTNLFPYWQVDKVVRDTSLNEGKVDGYIDRLTDVLTRLSKTRFTLEELQERPLPEGVDASKLEAYLDDEEFEALMEMNREEFYVLPSWRQRQLKQQAHLF